VRWRTSVQATRTALPQGPSLRSELYCLGPSSLNRPHPSPSPAQHDFVAERLIRTALAVSLLGPRRPAIGSELSLIVLYRPVALWDPADVHRLHAPSSFADDAGLSTPGKGLGTPNIPHPPILVGATISGLYYGSLSLRPADLFALLSELTRLSPCQRGLVLPGFRRFGRPRRRRI